MDYLLDSYVFRYLPLTICPDTKKSIVSMVMKIIRVADWICKTRELEPLTENHPTLVLSEFVYLLLCSLSLIFAFRYGSRYLYTWIGVYLLAIFNESTKFMNRSMDIVFHSQTMLTLMGMRTPLYLLCGVYHTLFFTSYVIIKRIRLKWWGEAAANGLLVFLLSLPFQIMGTKLLWWQWYVGDPRLMSTFYSVPLVMLAWYAMLGSSFSASLYLFRKVFLCEIYDWKRFFTEFLCVVGAALLALCLAALQYIVYFHVLHDIFRIHYSCCLAFLLTAYAIIALKALFNTKMEYDLLVAAGKDQLVDVPLSKKHVYALAELSIVAIHFLLSMLLAVFSSPNDILSEGVYQAMGPCNEVEQIFSPFGLILYRKKYFCMEEQEQKLFDFNCIPGGQLRGIADGESLDYYAICGTDFENQSEYITFIWLYCVTAFFIICCVTLYPAIKMSKPKAYLCPKTIQDNCHRNGFTAPKDFSLCEKKIENDRISQRTLGGVELRHRSSMLNCNGKKSRLPTPTRISSFQSK